MTRAELIEAVANRADVPPVKVVDLVDTLLPAIESALRAGQSVRVPSFGIIRLKNSRSAQVASAGADGPILSEQTERLVAAIAAAAIAFDDDDDASAFLGTPHPELDGLAPIDAAMSEAGAARVERILHAMTHGLPV